MSKTTAHSGPTSELRDALGSCVAAFIGIGVFSGMINVLMLTGSLFMLEVYDRVLPSRSVPTLIGLSVLVAVRSLFRACSRSRAAGCCSHRQSARLRTGEPGSTTSRAPAARARRGSDGLQPVRDLDTGAFVLSGRGPTALFDLPWMPLYVAICFTFHVMIGVPALVRGDLSSR